MSGIQAGHAIGKAHLSLSPKCIKFTQNLMPKVCDWCFKKQVPAELTPYQFGPDFRNMKAFHSEHTLPLDAWAAGAILYYMVTGERLVSD